MNVFAVREDLDIGLIIILCIFTAGLGALIYLAIYYDKDANRCIHCKSICKPTILEYPNENSINLVPIESRNEKNNQIHIKEDIPKFCFNCGIQIDERVGLNFCSYCGTKIK
jgi:hypothetical protein